jgi:hypothetical protein
MPWNIDDPMERRKRIAWSVATSSCIESRRDPVDVYNQIMQEWDEEDKNKPTTLDESHKT